MIMSTSFSVEIHTINIEIALKHDNGIRFGTFRDMSSQILAIALALIFP